MVRYSIQLGKQWKNISIAWNPKRFRVHNVSKPCVPSVTLVDHRKILSFYRQDSKTFHSKAHICAILEKYHTISKEYIGMSEQRLVCTDTIRSLIKNYGEYSGKDLKYSHETVDYRGICYCIVSNWAWPYGGGEEFLKDSMVWATSLGMRAVWVSFCRSDNTVIEKSTYECEHGRIIHPGCEMTSDAITKVLEDVQPTLVHHQGHRQDVVVDVCTMMNIPLLSGYHFWHGAIILGPKLNQNILHHLKEHKPDPKLISIYKKTNTHLYACSEFLQDVIHSVTGALLPVWNPVPIFHSLPPNDPTSSKFITWMHIHPLKGGTIVTSLMCILHEFPFQAIECEMPRYRTNVTDTIKEIAASRSASDPPILIKERQEDPSDIYRKTKVLLIPSIVDETFSRVSLEGLAHGIPIITTGSGYIKEMVGDGGIVLGMDSPIEEWAFNVRMLYSNDVVYKDISRRARLRYERIYAQKGMDGFKKMIRMALTPERKERHVMLFCPWCDQGLGIQSRQYAQSLLQKGICVSIFGFRPYYVETKEMDSRFQEDFDEWSMYDVYYSKNVRERVTDDEIIAFTKSRGITDCIIPETCWFRVFQIAQVLHDLEIRVHAVPNIEIVRKDELEKHDVFDSILCPNHICYDVLAKEREVLRPKLKYVGFTCPVCPIVPKMASSEEPFRFVLIGGMNGFFRKNCLKVCAGFVEAKKSLEGTAHSNIELVLTLQGNMRDIEQYRNIEGIRIIHQHQTHAQIWQHIASANVFVFVSRQEGLGLGMYEALACGTPVLTLDRPPFHEVIQEGRNGWVIPGFDVPNLENNSAVVSSHDFDQHDLSEKMRDIVVQKEGYQQIRKNTLVSREQIRRMFDIDFTSLFL